MAEGDLDELVALPEGHKERLAEDTLAELGVEVLRRQGSELIIACPVSAYHRDQQRNPTAALNADKLLFHCLGCGSGGTILWLIATLREITIEQAREWLHSKAGLNRAMDLPDLLGLFDSLYTVKHRAPLPYYSPRMLEKFTQTVPRYLTDERLVPQANAQRMGVCLDVEGSIAKVPTGPRAVIPHYWKGQLVGWQSRRLPEANPNAPKYHSTPGFPREETIYNYPHEDPPRTRKARRTLTVGHGVESPLSVLRHLDHIENMVATFGDAITDRQIQLLGDAFDDFYWWPDPDHGGWSTVESREHRGRGIPSAMWKLSSRCNVYIVESPYDDDPAALPEDVVDQLFGQAVPWQIWQRPLALKCAKCGRDSHKGISCDEALAKTAVSAPL